MTTKALVKVVICVGLGLTWPFIVCASLSDQALKFRNDRCCMGYNVLQLYNVVTNHAPYRLVSNCQPQVMLCIVGIARTNEGLQRADFTEEDRIWFARMMLQFRNHKSELVRIIRELARRDEYTRRGVVLPEPVGCELTYNVLPITEEQIQAALGFHAADGTLYSSENAELQAAQEIEEVIAQARAEIEEELRKAEEDRIAAEAARARMVDVSRFDSPLGCCPCICGTNSIIFSLLPRTCDRLPPVVMLSPIFLGGTDLHYRYLNTEVVIAGPVADNARYYVTTPWFVCGYEGNCRLWSTRLESHHAHCSLVVDDQHVYVTSGAMVSAFAKASGDPMWRYTQRVKDIVTAATIGADGLIYGMGRSSGIFLAIDSRTGERVWDFRLAECEQDRVFTPPVVGRGGLVYVGSSTGELYAMSSANQNIAWQVNIGKAILSPVAVGNGRVYIAAENMLFALDAAVGGAPQWVHEFDSPLGTPVFNVISETASALYVTTNNRLLAFSPEEGVALGEFIAPPGEHFPYPPAVNGRMLCIGSAPVSKDGEQYTNIHIIRVGADGNLNI